MANSADYISDGIEQSEAPIPGWWKSAFVTILAICPVYMLYYHTGAPGRSMTDSYDKALAKAAQKRYGEIGELQADGPTVVRFMSKPSWTKLGKVLFKSKCATCHGREGEGIVGPNLTDESYKNVRQIGDIPKVILEGANNNAMPAWADKLHVNDVVMISAYVATLRGTNASGGKAAEGLPIEPWPTSVEAAKNDQ